MTTLYKSYLTALQEGTINLNDANFSCLGVGEYVPDKTHQLSDLVGNEETAGLAQILCSADEVLVGNCIMTDSMSTLIEKIKSKLPEVEGVKMYVVYSGETLCFCEGVE